MKIKSIVKKLTLYSSLVALLLTLSSSNINKKSSSYYREGIKLEKGKIEYQYGTIYIGDEEYLNSIDSLKKNDLLVLDSRSDTDPDLKVIDAYKIDDPIIRDEILEGLLFYEEIFPTDWERSLNSMRREWYVHHTLYVLGYQVDRTKDVDFNNNDEKVYTIR